MMVTFVSQCEKKALSRTRRVLDAFADRIGDNTWQTVITQEGLLAVKKLLRNTASKNTAVSCHWIRSRARSELVWVVGNKNKFDRQGRVPVNQTDLEVAQYMDKSIFKTLPIIRSASSIAALFHDFGKATILFQKKLNPKEITVNHEPYRHEWISYRLFQTFVGQVTDDSQWLNNLSEIDGSHFPACYKDSPDNSFEFGLSKLPCFARLVAWLILTHHKLPLYPKWKEKTINLPSLPDLKNIDLWLDNEFVPLWNSPNCRDDDQQNRIKENWSLCDLPNKSSQWRAKACELASEAQVKLRPWLKSDTDWLHHDLFSTHLSRLSLILADHYYSSLSQAEAYEKGAEQWRNSNYKIYANTHWVNDKKQYKQQLDEHLTGVAKHVIDITNALPRLNSALKSLEPNSELTENVAYDEKNIEKKKEQKNKYGWQDNARKEVNKISRETIQNGFFGINMASTGLGKTRANAKIMTALGQQTGRIRFSVALGLRVLTLQTGRAFQSELKLTDKDLAIAVGGSAVKQLFENEQNQEKEEKQKEIANEQKAPKKNNEDTPEGNGSASSKDLIDSCLSIYHEGTEKLHSLSKWTKMQKGLDDLISAPVLVSTVDHLILATEGTKGGRQIPATLRLLTSDLVLDEPDDFGLHDLPALCRLVHWAGMLGSRVLLSTATIPPALVYALFQAYQSGWGHYARANLESWNGETICAWFDEQNTASAAYKDFDSFKTHHKQFVDKRITYLGQLPPKRKAEIVDLKRTDDQNIDQCLANTIQEKAIQLHHAHSIDKEGKTLSIGLVRMANINPLVAVAKALLAIEVEHRETNIYYCIYHSRYPLAIRSFIENKLDKVLNRKEPDVIWERKEIKKVIEMYPQVKHHIFIVLASPVAEVGRDHDYDWAIVEPSSMRSIIQLAGRILRHRDVVPRSANVLLLNENYRTIKGKSICYTRPGFESSGMKLKNHELREILVDKQYEKITAMQRIALPEDYENGFEVQYENLVLLEHKALAFYLKKAKSWWKNHPHWCGEVQRQQRFRDSKKDEAYHLWLENAYRDVCWKWKNEHVSPTEFGIPTISINLKEIESIAAGNYFWFEYDALHVYQQLEREMNLSLKEISERFGEVRLTEYCDNNSDEYSFHSQLGVYQDITG